MVGLWFVAGSALGVVHIVTQQWTIRRLEDRSVGGVLLLSGGGMLLRLGLAAGLLLAALQQGIVPALAAFGGLAVIRWLLLIVASRAGFCPADMEPKGR
ncbi:MAG: ATP synthase subunit I [Anaerolineae bacterium]